jgi:excisionase family DNA binding protein
MHAAAHINPDALLTEAQAADLLNLSIRTLQAWRVRGGGPLFVRLGRSVRYRRTDISKWLDASVLPHTSAGTTR